MPRRFSWVFVCLVLVFALCFIVDNFLEMKFVRLCGVSTTLGIFVIPISYIVGDTLVEVYGFRAARRVVWLTFAAYVFFIGVLQIACVMQPAEYWEGEAHFQYIFSASPRIMLCSMAAFVCGNLTNAWIMAYMKEHYGRWGFRARAVISTVFGEFVDSVTFFVPAFRGVIPMEEILWMCAVWPAAKTLYEAAILPVTVRVVRYAAKAEGLEGAGVTEGQGVEA